MTVVSSAPDGSETCMKDRMRLSARLMPGSARTRSTLLSENWCTKSRFGELRDVIQTSAPMCSIVTVAFSKRPPNRPVCTSTSITEKATPDSVMKKRNLSWKSIFQARSTIFHLPEGSQERCLRKLGRARHRMAPRPHGRARSDFPRAKLHPGFGAWSTYGQRGRAVNDRPHELSHVVTALESVLDEPRRHRLLDDGVQKHVGVAGRIVGLFLTLWGHVLGDQEHEPVVLRKVPREIQVGDTRSGEHGHRPALRTERHEEARQLREVVPAELGNERLLVREVLVERGRAVLHAASHLAHGHALHAPLDHQGPRGCQDLLPQLLPLALPPKCRNHRSVP